MNVLDGLRFGMFGWVTIGTILFLLNFFWKLVPLMVYYFDLSITIKYGAPHFCKTIFKSLSQFPFWLIRYDFANNFLFPNTWQYLSPCYPAQLGSMLYISTLWQSLLFSTFHPFCIDNTKSWCQLNIMLSCSIQCHFELLNTNVPYFT